jgi:hypothetical protein
MKAPLMTHPNRFVPAAIALALMAGFATPVLADSRTTPGRQLVLTLNNDVSTSVQTDPALHGEIRLTGDDLSCLKVITGGDAAVVEASSCGDSIGRLTVDVAPGSSVVLTQNGSADVQVGNTYGQLVANMGGSGALTAGHVAMLVLNVRGSGDVVVDAASAGASLNMGSSGSVRLREVTGPVESRQNGSGDLVIGSIESPALNITIDGSGDAMIGKGNAGNVRARVNGSGDLVVAATATNADLQASGGGDIRMGKTTGSVHKAASGGSDIVLQSSDLARFGIEKLATVVANSDDDGGTTIDTPSGTHVHIGRGHGSSSDGGTFTHVLAGAAVLLILFVIWRTIQRHGGVGTLRNRFQNTQPAQPSHPGVLAVRETISRLEGRLARVEGYVTTREFDLQRKFRELDSK